MSGGVEASFASNLALLLVSAVSSFFCADCSLLERSFAVVRCWAIAALVWRCELPLSTRLWPLLNFCLGLSSQRDILDSAKMPPFLDVSTPEVAVRALPRVSAQLSTSARDRGHLARRGSTPRGRADCDGWAASECEVTARGRPWGPSGLFSHARLGWGRRVRLADSQLKFLNAKKCRASCREDAWMGRRSFG